MYKYKIAEQEDKASEYQKKRIDAFDTIEDRLDNIKGDFSATSDGSSGLSCLITLTSVGGGSCGVNGTPKPEPEPTPELEPFANGFSDEGLAPEPGPEPTPDDGCPP